ncbi:Lin1244/Lin1753 domain-containing protein [Odoribacter laneus]|nr:Lin1244/Lin1753 domain-containing protein [Odoribacter laneus]
MMEYFSHNYYARNDPKMVKLMMRYALLGIGAYWCIVEMLYENGGYILRSEYERISFELHSDYETIKDIIENFELFAFKGEKFYSNTVLRRLKKRQEKSEKARQSIAARWEKHSFDSDNSKLYTDVLLSNNERNTNKKEKNKKNKIKINYIPPKSPLEPKERNIIPPTLERVKAYCLKRKNNIDPIKFINHYTAKNWMIGKNKMKDWQAAIRTWEANEKTQQPIKTTEYGKA